MRGNLCAPARVPRRRSPTPPPSPRSLLRVDPAGSAAAGPLVAAAAFPAGDPAPAGPGPLASPAGLCAAANGTLYVADAAAGRILTWDGAGGRGPAVEVAGLREGGGVACDTPPRWSLPTPLVTQTAHPAGHSTTSLIRQILRSRVTGLGFPVLHAPAPPIRSSWYD